MPLGVRFFPFRVVTPLKETLRPCSSGGPDAAFARMVELKRQLSSEEEVPKEAVTATVTSPIDSHSIWHSIRLTDIDFESLNWGQIDPPVTEKSCDKYSPDSEGGLSHI